MHCLVNLFAGIVVTTLRVINWKLIVAMYACNKPETTYFDTCINIPV